MTGRKLYDAITDAWAIQSRWDRERGQALHEESPAWGFLSYAERRTLNDAARKLTPSKRSGTATPNKS